MLLETLVCCVLSPRELVLLDESVLLEELDLLEETGLLEEGVVLEESVLLGETTLLEETALLECTLSLEAARDDEDDGFVDVDFIETTVDGLVLPLSRLAVREVVRDGLEELGDF